MPREKREARSRNVLLRDVEQVMTTTQREERPIEFHEDQVKQAQKQLSMKQHAQRLSKHGISQSSEDIPLQRDGAKYGQRRSKNRIQRTDRFPLWREQAGCSLQMSRGEADSCHGGLPTRLRTTIRCELKRRRCITRSTADNFEHVPRCERKRERRLA